MDMKVQLDDGSVYERSLCLHTFSNLSRVSPLVFIYLLKECYFTGKCKATMKFRALQQQVYVVLGNHPEPGPSTFVARCLIIYLFYGEYFEGFSHLIISSLRRYLKSRITTHEDSAQSKPLVARLFLQCTRTLAPHEERINMKMLQAYNIKLDDIDEILEVDDAGKVVEDYVRRIIESGGSYPTAAFLLQHFSIRESRESFLLEMVRQKHYRAAGKWAAFMGKPSLSLLVQEYITRGKTKLAVEVIWRNSLQSKFPTFYEEHKWDSFKKVVERGCWDLAESWAKNDQELLDYLVYLAMEGGYNEKAGQLSTSYWLKGLLEMKGRVSDVGEEFLSLHDVGVEECIWVDDVAGLQRAVNHMEGCGIVGIDCEWKATRQSGQSMVSIMQIAVGKVVYVVDLLKLCGEVGEEVSRCMERVMWSRKVLKLGYSFHCDMHQLVRSYGHPLPCFTRYEMLLDLQTVFSDRRGGLSSLAKNVLGVGLNKEERDTDWEQRPLTLQQLEYAALDAAVLLQIFSHIEPRPEGQKEGLRWKSNIVSLHPSYF